MVVNGSSSGHWAKQNRNSCFWKAIVLQNKPSVYWWTSYCAKCHMWQTIDRAERRRKQPGRLIIHISALTNMAWNYHIMYFFSCAITLHIFPSIFPLWIFSSLPNLNTRSSPNFLACQTFAKQHSDQELLERDRRRVFECRHLIGPNLANTVPFLSCSSPLTSRTAWLGSFPKLPSRYSTLPHPTKESSQGLPDYTASP